MRIAIVGAGVAGLISAWRLAEAGHSVTVYEQATIGQGASAKALGLLMPFHPKVSGLLAKVQRASIRQWSNLAPRMSEASGTPMEEFYRTWPAHPEHDPRGMCAQLRIPHILPVLAAAARHYGATIYEETPIADIHQLPHAADLTLLAAGIGNAPHVAVEAPSAQAIRVQPVSPLAAPVYADSLHIVPDWDGSITIGSHDFGKTVTEPNRGMVNDLLHRAKTAVPTLEGAKLITTWVSPRPTIHPLLPLLRPVEGSVTMWAVTGLGKLGYCLAPAVSDAVVELVA